MSNFLAVATVTATLSQLLQAAVGTDVPGATVTMARPDSAAGGPPTAAVNLYLFQVSPNAAWRNTDLPTRGGNGELTRRPRAALDLHYLLTFYGDETRLEPQRLLGSAVRTLHARPLLTREVIRDTIADPTFTFLAGSTLGEAIELVRFTPSPLSLEELSKLWSVFFQTPYALSVAYQASVVLIESEDTPPQAALPVRQPNLYVVPFRQPVIEQVHPAAGPSQPIVAGSTLLLLGQRLRGDQTQVQLGGIVATPAPDDVGDTQITLPLPAGLRAGVQGVQVVHPMLMGTPPVAHRGVESNVAPFVLVPTITAAPGGTSPPASPPRPPRGSPPDAAVTTNVDVTFDPPVGKTQRVILLLNEFHPPANRPPRAYS
ncbi:MAG: DUF4255 domain-containing protein, partial [Chloroflexota bacterium]